MAPLQHAILLVILVHVLATSAAGWLPFALPEALQWPATTLDRTATSTWELEAPSVLIGQGMIVGAVLRDPSAPQTIEAFRGIPYAFPPVGDRRFKPAIPIGKSQDIVNATRFRSRCPGKQLLQLPGGDGPESEDCLTLNVFRPKIQLGEKLPVALYIHGGAFNRGTATMHNTASMVAWSEKPFVAVSFNYRIGALGFLPSKLSRKEGILNLGLKDQVMVMEWVHENIDKFGGDPSQVTLFGLSAGAHSIGHHIMNLRETSPLFHRAIMESGASTARAVHPYDAAIHEVQFNEFLVEAGCANLASVAVFPCLQAQPAKTILDAQVSIFTKYNPSLRWAFQPVIDGDIILRRPIDGWASGNWNKVPIMTGFSHNEGTNYVPSSLSKPDEFTDFFHVLLPRLSIFDLKTIEELYPDPSTYPDSTYVDSRDLAAIQVGPQFKRVEAAYAQYAYICPVRQTANLAAPNQAPPVYLYHWALNSTVKGGANHGDHLSYQTMDVTVQEYSESQKEVAWAMHAYWTSFITTGNPNSIRGRAGWRAKWVRYNTKDPQVMIFGEGNDERAGGDGVGVATKMDKDEWSGKECDFWWKLSEM